ncbi:ribonuclease H2 subunit B-like [Lingula anatina]|uniref:Ribonuclease H2 subunit B-like n=1 Tax=Lingula anatina TaxID=7574 RepID=A0A2R2MRI1_LINAN|nr:ribonuclease H2 subunit B-like [Lingula anatina]|eukprot:XP_023932622.1 ribonuclease H2 subunit B-like [Lingula anatina]
MPKQERDRGNATDGEQNQWVLIAPEAIFSCETSEAPNVSFCKLRHPKTEEGAIFLFSSDNRQVFEVLQHKREFGSWIIEQTIQKDSSLLISTPVDPLFLSLPYLIKSAKVISIIIIIISLVGGYTCVKQAENLACWCKVDMATD